jgi:hypothetical protein
MSKDPDPGLKIGMPHLYRGKKAKTEWRCTGKSAMRFSDIVGDPARNTRVKVTSRMFLGLRHESVTENPHC